MIVLRNNYLEKLTTLIPELSQQSSQKAWNGFVKLTSDDLHKYICYYLNDQEFAADILQEVYLAFLKDSEGFCKMCEKEPEEIASKKVYAWLYKTARNKALNHLKNKKHATDSNKLLVTKAQQMKPEIQTNHLEAKETNDLVKFELSQLNERQQNLLTLKFYLEKSNAEIAQAINCEVVSVQKLVDRALLQLKNRLEKSGVHLSIVFISDTLISKGMCSNLPTQLLPLTVQMYQTALTGGILTKTILLKGILMKALFTIACFTIIGAMFTYMKPNAKDKPVVTQEKVDPQKVALSKSIKNKFAHELENVTPYSGAEFITLDNGFQIVLLPNNLPEKKVILKLCIKTGSLNENEKQIGFSNLLNRMAYSGTQNYSKDNLLNFYKKIQNGYGFYWNVMKALTGAEYTFFNIDETHVNEALNILADFAMNIRITTEDIEKEISELLKEKDYKNQLSIQKNFLSTFPLSLALNKDMIITTENMKNATQESLLAFYHNQYQPENMVLLVVGDINKQDILEKINSTVGLFKARSNKQNLPILENLNPKELVTQYFFDEKQFNAQIALNSFINISNSDMSYQEKVKQKIIKFALITIASQTLTLKNNQLEKSFQGVYLSVFNFFNRYEESRIGIYCDPKFWKKSLVFIENERRNLLDYKVTDQELSNFQKNYITQLDDAVTSMKMKKSYEYMEKLVACNSNIIPFQDAVQIRDLEKPIVNSITKEDVMKALKKYLSDDNRIISVTGNIEIKDAENEIKKAIKDAN